ncbi:FGGY-family carbohydrate kinase [Arenibaculum pallidiluteum]|uniref:FGGY-family carbohydrate kinase n=1 Tax=Arenibaculum pallidiluteum TaxID=2812559 RepID=UPI001A969DA7|nr:FGGY-family carbohydrate kinase [Arenibaculum pallidiluteum]
MDCVVGIDFGTESVRAHVFGLDGRPLGSTAGPYPTRFPQPAWAEQDPDDWWSAVAVAVRGALDRAGIRPGEVIGLGVDTTSCTVLALGRDLAPLRPALIWMDVRAAREAEDVAACGDPALRINGAGGSPVSAEWMIPKALWLKRNEPETWSRAAVICEFQDYVNLRLTGRVAASFNNISMRWHYQAEHGGLPLSLLDRVNLSDLAAKWPRDIVRPGETVGTLTAEAAAHLGLPEGLPVAQGGADAFIGMIGLGVNAPGQVALVTGSSHLQLGVSDRAFHAPGIWGTYAEAVYPNRYIVEGGQTSTGSIVNWFKSRFAQSLSYEDLNRDAAALPPGAEGLLVLDHFQGNRTPYTDARSRGAITGLTLAHTPAHVFRAIVEGICMGTRLILDTMAAGGFRAERITVAGGATNSPLWLQIHADVAGVPLARTEVPDACALGSAILATVATGAHPGIDEAIAAMVRVRAVVEPDPERHAAYQPVYERYRELYAALKPVREDRA